MTPRQQAKRVSVQKFVFLDQVPDDFIDVNMREAPPRKIARE
jgi:hypothetical protein